jgi:hypothetical protein
MIENQKASQRTDFFEQLHQQFLYLKGYGTYAYITAHAVDQLYESYLEQQKNLNPTLSYQHSEIDFIRRFIKSL